jgi:hypothetical protein
MQSNTTRAARAHSPENGTIKIHRTGKGHATVWKAVAAAVAAAYAAIGVANVVNLPFSAPAADVYVVDCSECNSIEVITYDFDGLLLGGLGDPLEPRIAIATQGAASAKAESGSNVFTAKAIVAPSKVAEAGATSQLMFIPHDPQGRGTVTVDLKLKMTASQASPDPINADHPGAISYAGYSVLVCGIGVGPGYVTYDETGALIMVGAPDCGLNYYGFVAETRGYAGGTWRKTLSKFGHTVWTLEGQGAAVSDDIDVGVTVIPGLPYFVMVSTVARTTFNGGVDLGAAYAAVDPVLEPDAVNPDVTIEFPNLAIDPNPQPVMGDLTPAALAAMGLDPQPLIDFGFFDPPSGGPPPPPPPPPPIDPPPAMNKDWCGPGFWLNNATRFGSSAWPATVPTYYDYNSAAGQLAGCPIASGNPTLLQVLQTPSLYFAKNQQGAGFNCIADYLSGKSGLGGTKTDNDGVCSIDQLGHHQ